MPVGAPKGNQNALKWTHKYCEEVLDKMEKIVNDLDDYKVNKETVKGYKYDFIGELTLAVGEPRECLDREIAEHAPDLKSRVETLKRLMERNCYTNTKKGIIKEATGIVNLKSNHHWTDRQTNEGKTEITLGITYLPPKNGLDPNS